MARRLYVGSLPYSVTSTQLKDIFDEVGTVQWASVIIDRITGQSKGFGFVEMGTEEEARRAMEKLHGHFLNGRKLIVNEARPRAEIGSGL